jgi:type ISP restriction-modification system protein
VPPQPLASHNEITLKPILLASAKLGEQLAALLNSEAEVKGVTAGNVRSELKVIGNILPVEKTMIDPATDLEIDAGWGHAGKDGVTMPGKGKLVQRDYTSAEREAIGKGAELLGVTASQALTQLGATTCDAFLNKRACWKNIPKNVWEYHIGGYQVMKKWLSYREAKLLGRSISPDEARYVSQMARRIAAICLLQPQLDANYAAVKSNAYAWPK